MSLKQDRLWRLLSCNQLSISSFYEIATNWAYLNKNVILIKIMKNMRFTYRTAWIWGDDCPPFQGIRICRKGFAFVFSFSICLFCLLCNLSKLFYVSYWIYVYFVQVYIETGINRIKYDLVLAANTGISKMLTLFYTSFVFDNRLHRW